MAEHSTKRNGSIWDQKLTRPSRSAAGLACSAWWKGTTGRSLTGQVAMRNMPPWLETQARPASSFWHLCRSNCCCRLAWASETRRSVVSGAVNCSPHAVQAATHGTEPRCLTMRTARFVMSLMLRAREKPVNAERGIVCGACRHVHTPILPTVQSSMFMRVEAL